MNSKLKICVIDDEPSIRKALIEAINESYELEVVGEAGSVDEGAALILDKNPDAIFLDIKLMEGDAFQLINILKRRLTKVPPIILNTGYNEFEYFEKTINDHKDYVIRILQKPFWQDWSEKQDDIIDAIIAYQGSNNERPPLQSVRIKIKSDYQTWFIDPIDLIYIEVPESKKGAGKIELHTKSQTFSLSRSLSSMMKELPLFFIRINRYNIVNTNYISHYDHSDHSLFLDGIEKSFPVGNAFYPNLQKLMQ